MGTGRFRGIGVGGNDMASAIMASFVYHTAVRPEMLPRLPMPRPTKKP